MIASIFTWIIEPLTYGFMQRGLIASVLVGIVCAVIGAFIVLRGMAFFGDALSHTILPGVAVGYLVSGGANGSLFWWALGTAVVSALSIGAISKRSQLREDTSIGIVFAGMFALGIALISTVRSYAVDLSHFLFGDVLGVSSHDLITILIFGAVVLIAIWAFYRQFVVISFDPLLAATLRLPVKRINNLLLILIAITVAVSLQIVGVALMVAMLVTPAATAFLVTKRLPRMMLLGSIVAVLSSIIGLYVSFYLSISSGSAVVLICSLIFAVTWVIQNLHGKQANR